MPSREQIAAFWGEDPNSCWKCDKKRRNSEFTIDRCHIVPRMREGEDVVENLVLLCRACHLAAPDVPDPACMWDYIDRGDEDGWDYLHQLFSLTNAFFEEPGVRNFMERWPAVFDAILGCHMRTVGFHAGVVSYESKLWVVKRTMGDVRLRTTHWLRHGKWCPLCLEDHTKTPVDA